MDNRKRQIKKNKSEEKKGISIDFFADFRSLSNRNHER